MVNLQILAERSGEREFGFRNLYRDQAEFRAICDDIEPVFKARARRASDPERQAEYEEVVTTLKADGQARTDADFSSRARLGQ